VKTDWKADADRGVVTGVDNGGCRVRVAMVWGNSEDELIDHIALIADAPKTAAERDRLREVNAKLVAALEEAKSVLEHCSKRLNKNDRESATVTLIIQKHTIICAALEAAKGE